MSVPFICLSSAVTYCIETETKRGNFRPEYSKLLLGTRRQNGLISIICVNYK